MTWKLVIPVATPSLNETQRMHWACRRDLKEQFGWLLVSSRNSSEKIPPANGRRRLVIERHSKRALDKDNLAGGAKLLVDCIKEQRLIQDDCPEACELEFRQVVSRRDGPHTVILLEDCA